MLDVESAISPDLPEDHPSVFWLSLDAQKCFDNIGCRSAAHACELAGLPSRLVRALGGIWLSSQRYLSAGGQISKDHFGTCNSIFQGCCLSVIA
eukprot:6486322-Amphidinium_carterae.1